MLVPLLSWITWNPHPVAFTIPIIQLPILWYGILFTTGFIAGYFVFRTLLTKKLQCCSGNYTPYALAQILTDKVTLYVLIATLAGARGAHILFYDLPYYQSHFWEIFNLRAGGLASHGAAVAIPLALYIFFRSSKKQFPFLSLTFLDWLDLLCVPAALAGTFIRLGNFINQELVGTPSSLPWAVIFENPMGVREVMPRHPVQLYEAGAYFITFLILYRVASWNQSCEEIVKQANTRFFSCKVTGEQKTRSQKRAISAGVLCGLFFFLIFTSRFVLEKFKTEQSMWMDESILSAGQILSVPFIFLGLFLLLRKSLLFFIEDTF